MQKKIFSLLVLLMTAVTGAWAQEQSETIVTTAQIVEGTHFTISNNNAYADTDGMIAVSGITVTAKNEETITKVVITCTYDPSHVNDGNTSVSSGTKEITNGGGTITVTGVNASTFTFTCSYNNPQFVQFVVYYTEASAESSVTVTEITKNQWQFLMPDYAVVANIEYDTELALNEVDDNTAKLEEWNGYEADVTLTRTLAAGVWNTLAAPFGISATNYATLQQLLSTQGGTIAVKELTSTTLSGQTLTLNFTDATQIEAGKPYLVKVSKELNLATLPAAIDVLGLPINPFKGVIISKTAVPVETSYVNFIPTLGKTLVTGPTGDEDNEDAVLFLAAGNTLKNPTVVNDPEQQSSYLKGFRAYFQLKDASNARSITLNLGDEATSIISTTDNTDNTDSVYDLQGRKVDNAATKGVYIQNGRKVVVK